MESRRAGMVIECGQTLLSTPSMERKGWPNRAMERRVRPGPLRSKRASAGRHSRIRSRTRDQLGQSFFAGLAGEESLAAGGQTLLSKFMTGRAPPLICGDGGGSNSPSKALDLVASTSVVGVFLSRVAGRAPTRYRLPQVGSLIPAYRPVGGPHLRFYRPSRPAEGRPGGRSLTRQRVRKKCCQLSGCRSD